jgi:hypothetical protein
VVRRLGAGGATEEVWAAAGRRRLSRTERAARTARVREAGLEESPAAREPEEGQEAEVGLKVGHASEVGPEVGHESEVGPEVGHESEVGPEVGHASEVGPEVGHASEVGPEVG